MVVIIPTQWEIEREVTRAKKNKPRSYEDYMKAYEQLRPLREAGNVRQYFDPMRRYKNPFYQGAWKEWGYKAEDQSAASGPADIKPTDTKPFILIVLIGVLVGGIVGWYLSYRKKNKEYKLTKTP